MGQGIAGIPMAIYPASNPAELDEVFSQIASSLPRLNQ
jgi:hypothetical protein